MVRGLALPVVVFIHTAGCSLILDFSNKAIPIDAAIDAPYTDVECMYKEPNDTVDTAAMITTVDTGPAASCPHDGIDDHDFYRFTVPAMTAKVTITTMFTSSLGDLDLRLYNKTGATILARSSGFGDTETIICPGSSPACQ